MSEQREYSEKEIIINSIRQGVLTANEENNNVIGVMLYGSRSRETHTSSSDADLIFVLANSEDPSGIINLRQEVGKELRRLGIVAQYSPRKILQRADLAPGSLQDNDLLDKFSIAIFADSDLENEINTVLNNLDRINQKI